MNRPHCEDVVLRPWPRCESPIEEAFAHEFLKRARADVGFASQVDVRTICGSFRIDFVVTDRYGYRIGIELDGKEWHDPYRDEWRDAMILGANSVDEMVRFRGQDIWYWPHECMWVLLQICPTIFDEDQKGLIAHLSSRWLPRTDFTGRSLISFYLPLNEYDDDDQEEYLDDDDRLEREVMPRPRTQIRVLRTASTHSYWRSMYEFAVSVGGGNLDNVIRKDQSKRSG